MLDDKLVLQQSTRTVCAQCRSRRPHRVPLAHHTASSAAYDAKPHRRHRTLFVSRSHSMASTSPLNRKRAKEGNDLESLTNLEKPKHKVSQKGQHSLSAIELRFWTMRIDSQMSVVLVVFTVVLLDIINSNQVRTYLHAQESMPTPKREGLERGWRGGPQ